MPKGECQDQKAPNRRDPNEPASVKDLQALGICYWKLNADADTYPTISVSAHAISDGKQIMDSLLTLNYKYICNWSLGAVESTGYVRSSPVRVT